MNQTDSANSETPDPTGIQFSLVAGGPFHNVLQRLGLTGPDRLIPTVTAVAQTLLVDDYSGLSIFTDPTVYARYLVAIWFMIATERYADGRISLLVRQFQEAGLLPAKGRSNFLEIVRKADRRTSSTTAEMILLVTALGWSILGTRLVAVVADGSWESHTTQGIVGWSWAGEAAAWISSPLFLFLFLRWLWRFIVWTALLWNISGLRLNLMPLHPDRAGGLGFLALFPGIFSGFVFATSSAVAAAMIKALGYVDYSQQALWLSVLAWLVIVLIIFLVPLAVFVRPLYATREKAMLEYSRVAQQHHLAFHRKWIGDERHGNELLGSADPSSASDLNASVQATLDMHVFPVDLQALVQLLVSALVPFLAVLITQIPAAELLEFLIDTIL
jgi:hypothetical protein